MRAHGATERRKEIKSEEIDYLCMLLDITDEHLNNLKKPGKVISIKEYNRLIEERGALTLQIHSAMIVLDDMAYKTHLVSKRPILRLVVNR